jgi:glucosamine-6-phosphate deaminase
MNVPVRKFETAIEAGAAMADRILTLYANSDQTRAFLLGCPGGRSPKPVYAALADRTALEKIDLSRLVIVMMDEYVSVDADGSPVLPHQDAHFSCRGFGVKDILAVINDGLSQDRRIPELNLWMPEIERPSHYDKRLAAAGGIDYFILASGAGDGHIGFNPPGSAFGCETRIVELAQQTKRDNLKTFPDFKDMHEVPTHGLTVGIGTIVRLSKEVGMILWGRDKREAFQRITSSSTYDSDWPATVAAHCKQSCVFADYTAAGGRYATN